MGASNVDAASTPAASGLASAGSPSVETPSDSALPPGHFHREEFWNLPNTITLLRIAVVPVMLLLPVYPGVAASRFFAWCFVIAALSDILDGWLARRGAQVTRIGKLLDPLADKLLVSTTLIMLITVGRIPPWAAWMVVVIIGRELAVTGLRGIASSHGHVVAASGQGKLKTLMQNSAAVALLFHFPVYGLPSHEIGMTLLTLATALTLWSGYGYFADYFGWRSRADGAEVPN